jgi:DNA-binding MarR family transcriptional regulator
MGQAGHEAQELADRFLKVLGWLFKVAGHRIPQDVAGQLHMNQLHALHMLNHEPGISQKDIAERLQITPAAVSTAMREMEARGLIERRSDPDDARQMHLYLCPFGQRIVDEAYARRRDAIARLLGELPLNEQRTIVRALERALKARQEEN